jgi:hypothetical protein
MCVCVRERERDRQRERVCVCMCVCVCMRKRVRQTDRERERVCKRERQRERERTVIEVELPRPLFTHHSRSWRGCKGGFACGVDIRESKLLRFRRLKLNKILVDASTPHLNTHRTGLIIGTSRACSGIQMNGQQLRFSH